MDYKIKLSKEELVALSTILEVANSEVLQGLQGEINRFLIQEKLTEVK